MALRGVDDDELLAAREHGEEGIWREGEIDREIEGGPNADCTQANIHQETKYNPVAP